MTKVINNYSADFKGLLHVGDKIKEVNGRDMSGNPKELQDLLVRTAFSNSAIN